MQLNKYSGYDSLQAACKDGYIYGVSDSLNQKYVGNSAENHSDVNISTLNSSQTDSEFKNKATEVN